MTAAGYGRDMGRAVTLAGAALMAACAEPEPAPTVEVPCGSAGVQARPPFTAVAPGCTRFLGALHAPDPDAGVLAPLATLRHVDGGVSVFRNHGLAEFRPLGRLETVGGPLSIRFDDGLLTGLAGLEQVREVGGLELAYLPALRSLAGLDRLEIVRGDVTVTDLPALPRREIDDLLARVRVEGQIVVE